MSTTRQKAVYFRQNDYAGAGARWAIAVIDVIVLVILYLVILIAGTVITGSFENSFLLAWLLWLPVWLLYVGALHSMGLGAVGYLALGYRLVDYTGERPSLWRSMLRVSAILLLPFEAITDLTCSCSRHTRQAFWDRFAETVVIRKSAQPVGQTELASCLEFALAFTWVMREPRCEEII